MAVSLDIGYKLNISQTYVRSIHVLFPGEWERALHGHCNNMINVNKKRIGSISIVFLKSLHLKYFRKKAIKDIVKNKTYQTYF